MTSFLRRAIFVGLVAALAMPFVYTPSTTFPFVFGKGIFFAVLVEILAALYLVLAWLSPEDRPRRSTLLLVLLGYFVALTISTFSGVDPWHSFWGNHERMSGLFTQLHFFVYYLVARSVLRTKREWQAVLIVFLTSSAVMAAIALAEHYSSFAVSLGGTPGGRVWGTLGNYIYLGVYMSFALFFAGYLFSTTRHRLARIALVVLAALDLYIIFLNQSRATLLALIFTIIALAFLSAWRARGKARTTSVALAILLLLGGGGLYLFRTSELVARAPALSRLLATTLTSGGDRTRIIAWEIAVQAWRERPFFGWGPENYYVAFNKFYRPESLLYSFYETWFDRAHNSLLDALSMTGAVGLLLYLGVFAAAVLTVVRGTRRGFFTQFQGALLVFLLGAYVLENLFAFDALPGFLLFYLLLALVDALAGVPIESQKSEILNSKVETNSKSQILNSKHPTAGSERAVVVKTVAVGLLATAAAVALIYVNVRQWQANSENLQTIAAIREARYTRAAELHALSTSRSSPHANQIRADFAREVGMIIGNVPPERSAEVIPLVRTALLELQQNVKEGHDVFDSVLLAQILTMVSGSEPRFLGEAERVLREAIPLSPKRQQVLFALARVLILEERPAEALVIMEQTTRDEPRLATNHMMYALTLMSANQAEAVWREVQAAMKLGYSWQNSQEMQLAFDLAKRFGKPGDPRTLAEFAKLEARAGYTTSALFDVDAAITRDPTLSDYKIFVDRIIRENAAPSATPQIITK